MSTESKRTRSRMPVFVSQHEAHERARKGTLSEAEMETVAEIHAPSSGEGGAAAASGKKLQIKCVDTSEGVVCTYKWV